MTEAKGTSLQSLADAELVHKCKHGENDAFNVLYNRYRLQLFSYLHHLLAGHSEQTEDLFQMTWIRAVRNLPRYTEKQRFFPWLCRIGHNLVMDFYRAKNASVPEAMPDVMDPRMTPQQALQRAQLEEALAGAIAELPEEQRVVLMLRRDGVPFRDIAEREGISLNTALGRMHYAVLRLKKLLSDYL